MAGKDSHEPSAPVRRDGGTKDSSASGRPARPASRYTRKNAPPPRRFWQRRDGAWPITLVMIPVFLAGALFATIVGIEFNTFRAPKASAPIVVTATPGATAAPTATVLSTPQVMPTPATSRPGVAAQVGSEVVPIDLFVTMTKVGAREVQLGGTDPATGQSIAPIDLLTAAGQKAYHQSEQQQLDSLIESAVATIYAKQHHLLATAKQIQARTASLASQYGGAAAFQAGLAAQGYTQAAIDQIIKNQVTENNVFTVISKQAPLDGKHVRHILFATKDKVLAQKTAKILQANHGATFAALAKKDSIDTTSGALGGDLGVIAKGQTVAAFDKVAFSLKPGVISDPVQTQFGWHIIEVLGSGRSQAGMSKYFSAWLKTQRAKLPVHIYVTIPKN
jgi:parvulin-like peptidyl-prolyl isomerase